MEATPATSPTRLPFNSLPARQLVVTFAEAAELLGVSVCTVQRLVEASPHGTVGGAPCSREC